MGFRSIENESHKGIYCASWMSKSKNIYEADKKDHNSFNFANLQMTHNVNAQEKGGQEALLTMLYHH